MRTSTHYKVYDHEENKIIATDATIQDVVGLIKIPYEKVSSYSLNGWKFARRYTIQKNDPVLDKLVDDLYVTLIDIKSKVDANRFHSIRFCKKRERRTKAEKQKHI